MRPLPAHPYPDPPILFAQRFELRLDVSSDHNSLTENAVASFFTPTSQKPRDQVVWSERAPDKDTPATLLVARYEPDTTKEAKDADGTANIAAAKRQRIAAFDLVCAGYQMLVVVGPVLNFPSRTLH